MKKQIIDYCMESKQIYEVIELYENNFKKEYRNLKHKSKKNIFNFKDSIFRHWYYSSLVDYDVYSPANYINHQIREKFGDNYVVIPYQKATIKGNRIGKFELKFKFFSLDDHPVVEDLKTLINYCTPTIQFDKEEELQIVHDDELLDALNFNNSFYVMYLVQVAYQLKLLKDMPSLHVKCAQVTNKCDAFFELSKSEQFEKIFEASINVSSKMLSTLTTIDYNIFTKKYIISLLNNDMELPTEIDNIFTRIGIDINEAVDDFEDMNLENIEQFAAENEELAIIMALKTAFDMFLDMWFICVFGYYLQVIQPLYNESFNFNLEFNCYKEALDGSMPMEPYIYNCPQYYDLTPLGEKLISKFNNKLNDSKYQEFDEDDNLDEIHEEIMRFDEKGMDNDLINLDFEEFAKSFIDSMINGSNIDDFEEKKALRKKKK